MRRHKMGLGLRLFPFSHSALALASKNPYKIKLRTSALVQSDGGRSVIGIPGQIGLYLSYVIDPINPKMRAMTWNYYD
jgi:hypothetical protein